METSILRAVAPIATLCDFPFSSGVASRNRRERIVGVVNCSRRTHNEDIPEVIVPSFANSALLSGVSGLFNDWI